MPAFGSYPSPRCADPIVFLESFQWSRGGVFPLRFGGLQRAVEFFYGYDGGGHLAGFDAAERFLADAGASGQLRLRQAELLTARCPTGFGLPWIRGFGEKHQVL